VKIVKAIANKVNPAKFFTLKLAVIIAADLI